MSLRALSTNLLKVYQIKFMLLGCFYLILTNSQAQTENPKSEQHYIKGQILDINTMKSIPSVQLIVKNDQGATIVLKFSDADGCYKMNTLEIGNYSITLKQGKDYDNLTQNFSIDSDDNLSMNFYLRKKDISSTEEAEPTTSEIIPVTNFIEGDK